MSNPIAPWHMWGTTVNVDQTFVAAGPGSEPRQPSQLVKVSYKRPENWRFFLYGRLLGGDTAAGIATTFSAVFDIYAGLGRSRVDTQPQASGIQGWAVFRWVVPVGTLPGQQAVNVKYATRVVGPVLDDTVMGAVGNPIELIPAEEISCRVRTFILGDPAITIQAELGAFFAPNVHVRPDWFVEQFPGSETGGS